MNKMFISKISGKSFFQEGKLWYKRDFGEHPQDVAIIPTVTLVDVTTGRKRSIPRRTLDLNFIEIKTVDT